MLLNIFGVLVGALVTLIVARIYYERAGKELREESNKLKSLNILILQALEEAGFAEFTKNEEGEIKGLRIIIRPLTGHLKVTGYAPTVITDNKDKSKT